MKDVQQHKCQLSRWDKCKKAKRHKYLTWDIENKDKIKIILRSISETRNKYSKCHWRHQYVSVIQMLLDYSIHAGISLPLAISRKCFFKLHESVADSAFYVTLNSLVSHVGE